MGDVTNDARPRQRRLETRRGGYEYEVSAFPRPVDFDLPDDGDLDVSTDFLSGLFDDPGAFDEVAQELAAAGSPDAAAASAAASMIDFVTNPGGAVLNTEPGIDDVPSVGVPGPARVQTGNGQFGKVGSTGSAGTILPPAPVAATLDLASSAASQASSFASSLLDGAILGVPKKVLAAGAAALLVTAFVVKRAKKSRRGRRR